MAMSFYNIIDYFLIRKNARKQVADVKVLRGAEICNDHYLLPMKKLKMQRRQMTTKRGLGQRIRTDRLKDYEVKCEFQAVVRAKFEETRA